MHIADEKYLFVGFFAPSKELDDPCAHANNEAQHNDSYDGIQLTLEGVQEHVPTSIAGRSQSCVLS